ncbi:MAG: hypothetical protein ACXVUL_23110 [Solirubrobacteraceae bacterium]
MTHGSVLPEPVVSVPEPEPEPEPVVSVPEPLPSVPEPLVSVPEPLVPEALLSWPLLVGFVVVSVGLVVVSVGLVVVPVGLVVVSVGAVPVLWPEVESLEHVSDPVAPGCVAAPVTVVWVEPSVGQAVTCVSAPASAPSVPLAAPAVDVSAVLKRSLVAERTRLVACVLAALWATAVCWTTAGRVAALVVCVKRTMCNGAGAACELEAILWERTTVTCALK